MFGALSALREQVRETAVNDLSIEDVTSRRILLVDDIELTRVLTEAILKGATYHVDSVGDGPAALRALDDEPYDLVLMDLDMPGIDGHAAVAAIRRRDEGRIGGWRTPQVVALSSRDGADVRERSLAVGMTDHICRPIGPTDLIREVARLLASCPPAGLLAQTWCRETYLDLVDRLGINRMRGFLGSLLDYCETMRDALANEEASDRDLRRQAHDLVSVGGMLGFEALSRACFVLQTAATGPLSDHARADVTTALDNAVGTLSGCGLHRDGSRFPAEQARAGTAGGRHGLR